MKSIFPVMLSALLIFSMGCQAQSKKNEMLEEAKVAIAKSNAVYRGLFLKNDGSILTCYAEDACIMPPNAKTICGKEEMGKFFKDAYAAGVRGGRFIQTEVYGSGEGYVTEVGRLEAQDGNDKVIDDGKYLVLWKKTKDGWKMYRDMFSSNHQPK